MSLQFIDFKKRVGKNEELEIDFNLANNDSLAIVDKDLKTLKIFKNIFSKKEDYRGKVLVNGTDIMKNSSLIVYDNIGIYSNFSLYRNFKFILSIYSVKINKETLLKYFEELLLDFRKKYKILDKGEKERVEFLLTYLIAKEVFLIDLSEKKFINTKLISEFLRLRINKLEKNIVVLSKEINEISSLMNKSLVLNENKQEYYGKNKDFELVKNLVVLKLPTLGTKNLETRLTFDHTIVNNKLILEKNNLEAALYYFVSNDIDVESITNFVDNDDLYVKGE